MSRCLSEIAEIEAGEGQKIKEFTCVIDCFLDKPNEDIGDFWLAPNTLFKVLRSSIPSDTFAIYNHSK